MYDDDDDDNNEGSAPDSAGEAEEASQSHRMHTLAEHSRIVTYTAFDAYFVSTSRPTPTSTNVFSNLVLPLTTEEYSTGIRSALSRVKALHPETWSHGLRAVHFCRFSRELEEGFNLLFYGFGSKRDVLNQFAVEICSTRGHTVVANGFQPQFTLKDLLHAVEKVPGVPSMPLLSSGVDGQTRRISDFFANSALKHHLYIIVHNIDAPAFRTARTRSCLSLLALNPYIHLIASVDHINGPLLWSSTETSARKPESTLQGYSPPRGFSWLWHDLTTLAPYDVELSYADRSSISGASTVHSAATRKLRESGGVAQNGPRMTETAALHILASVTQKAKKLFALMATRQLGRMDEVAESATDAPQNALAYDVLFVAARDNFIATNDTALRSLLSEFRDHGLVVGLQGGSGSGESLWIPLRKERLASILEYLNTE